jgi:rhodanese-related sulfurtransferase
MGGNEMQFPEPAVEVPPVDPETVKRRLDETGRVVLLDVRMPEAYQRWHIEGDVVESIHVPYDRFTGDTVEEAVLDRIPADERVTVVCAKGLASEFVAGELAARGYDVDHMAEGMIRGERKPPLQGWVWATARRRKPRATTRLDVPRCRVLF